MYFKTKNSCSSVSEALFILFITIVNNYFRNLIDVPFRYHVPNIYHNLTNMCKVLGVRTRKYDQDIALYDCNGTLALNTQVFTFPGDFIMGYSTFSLFGFSLPKFFLRNFTSKKFYIFLWVCDLVY
jgi:hypothetical protein